MVVYVCIYQTSTWPVCAHRFQPEEKKLDTFLDLERTIGFSVVLLYATCHKRLPVTFGSRMMSSVGVRILKI